MNSNSRNSQPSRRGPSLRAWMGIILGAGLLLVALEAIRHMRAIAQRQPADDAASLVLGLNDRRYVDPEGRFALTVPAGWIVRAGAEIAPRTAVFRGPRDLEIWVQAEETPHRTLQDMRRELWSIEESFGADMNITNVLFKGAPAIERMLPLASQQVLAVDFISGRMGHHLQAAAPRTRFASYERFLRAILDTYEAGPIAPADPLLDRLADPPAPPAPLAP